MTNTYRHEKNPVINFDTDPGKTEQHHKDDVSTQMIVNKARKTGVVEHVAAYKGTYGDFINAPDFIEASLQIARAKTMFESVPAHIRKDFQNDPAHYLEFMQDPKNREKIEAYGLDASHLPEVEADTPPASPPAAQPPAENPPADNSAE